MAHSQEVPADIKPAKAPPAHLKLMIKEARMAFTKSHEERVKPGLMYPMKNQPRLEFDEEYLAQLQDDIAAVGQIYPCIVRSDGKGKYEIIDGECRWRACQALGILCWVKVVDVSDAAAAFVVAVIANMQRKGHSPREMTKMVERMYHEFGVAVPEIADVMRLHPPQVYDYIRLGHLNEGVWQYLDRKKPRNQRITLKEAVSVAAEHHLKQVAIAQAIVRQKGVKTAPKPLVTGPVQAAPVSFVRNVPRNTSRSFSHTPKPLPSVTPAKKWDNFVMRIQHVQRMVEELRTDAQAFGPPEASIAQARSGTLGSAKSAREMLVGIAEKAQTCASRISKLTGK